MVSLKHKLGMNLAGCLSFLAATSAFQIPPSLPLTRHSYLIKSKNIEANESSTSAVSATALHGKLWKRLQIEEDDPADGTSWYLINCIAGVEFDLLNQCREVCKHFSTKDVEKFVVPTERHLRSHGDKKKVVDVKVRYPGYVFCKIRLCEDVYETLQELEYARSWMGTVNRKGHKKLPPAPMPLGPEEVAKFKGLEEEQEVFEDMFGGDYTGRADQGADLLSQYAGYDVGQMVKILKGRFEGEDGTIRRLKNGQLMVRMFTYGQNYDEWFDPDAIRPLTDLEVMRGLSGPTTPINQDQFDVSIGKKDPSILEGPMDGDNNMIGSGGGASSLRSGLLQSAGAGGTGRNRREDRIARGETGNRDLFGRSAEDIKREEQNWLAYREQQRAGGSSSSSSGTTAGQPEPVKKKKEGPKKGEDTWGIVERSSWDGGEYGFEANSEEEERERKRRTAELYKDRVPRDRRGRDGRESFDQRQSFRGEVGNRREQNSMERRSVVGQSRDPNRNDNDWSSFSSNSRESTNKEEDFFDSLMSQLSNDLRDDSAENDSRVRGSRRHDNAGPNTAKAFESSSGAEDSFFENLMAELGGAIDKSDSYSSRTSKSEKQIDDDDFFSSLEAELSQSLGGGFQPENESEGEEDVDDFFANLENEMSKVGGGSTGTGVERNDADDFFGSSRDNDADDFFSSLIDDLAQEMSNEETEPEVITSSKAASGSKSSNLASFTVPELKNLLRSKGLKVGGTKAELIDRLQSAS